MFVVILFFILVMKFVNRILNLCVLFVCMLNSYFKLEIVKDKNFIKFYKL